MTHLLAEGGMGIVLAAEHLKLGQIVAMKFMLPALASNPEAEARFFREARAAALLQSEHVARILDVGENDFGLPFIVMEYLEGNNLAAVIRAAPEGLPIEDAVEYVLHACDAIAEAHALGIIHRDLKPENLFLTRRRGGKACIKVLDFGISKVLDEPRGQRCGIITRDVMGSPAYMSPEQMRSTGDVDRKTDIWSLGVILYELISGEQPFVGQSLAEICLAVSHGEPRPLAELRPDVPAGLAAIVHRCLSKDPALRDASVLDLMQALSSFSMTSAQPGFAASAARESMADDIFDRSSPPPTTRTSRSRWETVRRIGYRTPLLTLSAVLGVLALVASATMLGSKPSPLAEPPSPARSSAMAEGTGSERAPAVESASAPVVVTSAPSPSPPAVRAELKFSGVPILSSAPKPIMSAQLGQLGAPKESGPASKGGRFTSSEPRQVPAWQRNKAQEAAKASDEDVYSTRK